MSTALSLPGRFCFAARNDNDVNIFTMDVDGNNIVQLTDAPRWNYSPRWSPDGRQITFVSGRDGSDQIYIMNQDGTGQRRLTGVPGEASRPSFSPDGTQLVFTSSGVSGHAIFTMDIDGGNRRQITQGTIPHSPCFTADGKSIVFSDQSEGLHIVDAHGGDHKPLFGSLTRDFEWPVINPNGQQLAFTESTMIDIPPCDYNYIYVICLANMDGTNLTKITTGFAEVLGPTFSSDGNWLAFYGRRHEDDERSIFVVPTAGPYTDIQELFKFPNGSLAWGPTFCPEFRNSNPTT